MGPFGVLTDFHIDMESHGVFVLCQSRAYSPSTVRCGVIFIRRCGEADLGSDLACRSLVGIITGDSACCGGVLTRYCDDEGFRAW